MTVIIAITVIRGQNINNTRDQHISKNNILLINNLDNILSININININNVLRLRPEIAHTAIEVRLMILIVQLKANQDRQHCPLDGIQDHDLLLIGEEAITLVVDAISTLSYYNKNILSLQ